MNLRVAVPGEDKRHETRIRSGSEPEEGDISRVRQTRNQVIYTCPG